jgi:ATP-dependent helicase/nuclease subunit A
MSDHGALSQTGLHRIVAQLAPSVEQLPAIFTRGRDVVVTAGAGTGKTRTLVARFLSLLAEGLSLRAIVAITFTNKAAREMRNRVREEMRRYLDSTVLAEEERGRWQELYGELDGARIGTIHSLCTEILRSHPAEARLDPLFAVLDEGQANLLRRDAVRSTMAWAADTDAVVDLFAVLGERDLEATLDKLLQQRLEVREAYEQMPTDLLGGWAKALTERQERILEGLRSEGSWMTAIEVLRAHAARRLDDRMEIARRDALAAIDEAYGSLHEQLGSLSRLDRINLVGGRQAAWSGGADERDEVKDALRTVRDRWHERAELLGLALTPIDAQLAALTPALRAASGHSVLQYEALKRERNALDFDDLEFLALELLRTNEEARRHWQGEVAALLVDEFQDTNGRQRDLVRILNDDRGRLFIVGDAKQSIYRFRGADVAVFREERQQADASGGATHSLETSYRAHRRLLDGLNALLRPVLGEEGDLHRPWVEPFAPLTAYREQAEPGFDEPYLEFHLTVGTKRDGALERAADALAGRLVEMVEGSHPPREPGGTRPPDYGGIAILCRASSAFGAYENALERAGIPFLTVAGRGFYNRPEIRDLMNALQALTDPTDDLVLVGLLRSPVMGLSDAALYSLCNGRSRRVWEIIRQEGQLQGDEARRLARAVEIISELNQRAGRSSVADLLDGLLDLTDYRAALIRAGNTRGARNVSKLLWDARASGIVSAGEFLEYINGLRESGTREGEARAAAEGVVQILSIHAAKGLEFPVVVIGDVTSSASGRDSVLIDPDLGVLLPLKEDSEMAAVYRLAKLRDADQESAESNRLLYVAATRAREKLLLSGCVSLKQDGTPSRIGQWLRALDGLDGFGLASTPIPYDEQGDERRRFDWTLDGNGVRCIIYEPGYHGPRARTGKEPGSAETIDLPPPLLGPVVLAKGEPEEAGPIRERIPRQRAWRVVPRSTGVGIPRWVVGSLVHEALAAWRFPGVGFNEWLAARARQYGLSDAREVGQVVDESARLMARLRAHPLYTTMAAAERRFHEVPYTLMTDDKVESGAIDALFQRDGIWTIVEFKTNRISDEASLDALLRSKNLSEQAQRYVRAARLLLGEVAGLVLCLLDYRGGVRVKIVPAAPMASDPGDGEHL